MCVCVCVCVCLCVCIPIHIQQDATLNSLFIFGNSCTCFRLYLHLSSGAHTTVSTETCRAVSKNKQTV